MKKVIALNTVSQLVGRGVGAATAFIVTLLVARHVGASGYGDFVKITTYVAFFYLLADFGINAVYLQQAGVRTSWPALIHIRTIGGLLLIAAAVVIVCFLPGTGTAGYTSFVRLGILLYSPTILFQAWITTGNAIFQKRLRYDLAAWAILFGSLVTVGLLWVLLFLRHMPAVTSALLAMVAGAVVTAATAMSVALRSHPLPVVRIDGRAMARLFLPAIPLGVTLLFNLVYFRADSVVITLTRPTAEVGVYGLAYKVFEVVLVFPTFFMNAVYPIMLKQDRSKFRKFFENSFLFLLIASLLSLVVVWFAAPALSLVKSDFTPSIGALRVLSLGLPFFFVTSATMWALIALKKQSGLVFIYGASMAVNLAGNILFVPAYGFMAAAWMTVASEGLVMALSGLFLIYEIHRTH